MRNKIRLNIIPQLLDINPAAADHIQQTAEHVSDALAVYDEAIQQQRQEAVVEESADRLVIDLSKVRHESLLFEILRPYAFSIATIASIDNRTGKLFSSADYDMVVDRGCVMVERRQEPMKPMVMPEDGVYVVGTGKFSVRSFERTADFVPSLTPLFPVPASGWILFYCYIGRHGRKEGPPCLRRKR